MAARKTTAPASPTVTRYQAARIVGVHERSIQRMLESGELPGVKNEHGVWQIPLETCQALAADKPPVEHEGEPADVQILHHASSMLRSASESLQWLVKMQQEVIGSLSSELGKVQEGYAQSLRQEAAQRLETELALRQEARRDKALDEVIPFAERVLNQSMQARAGSKVLDALTRLGDEQWETVRGMATELLEMPESDVAQLDELRAERKKETKKNDYPKADTEPAPV